MGSVSSLNAKITASVVSPNPRRWRTSDSFAASVLKWLFVARVRPENSAPPPKGSAIKPDASRSISHIVLAHSGRERLLWDPNPNRACRCIMAAQSQSASLIRFGSLEIGHGLTGADRLSFRKRLLSAHPRHRCVGRARSHYGAEADSARMPLVKLPSPRFQ